MSAVVTVIDAAEFKAQLDENQAALLIDVREPVEFQMQRIQGVKNIPKDLLLQQIKSIAPDHQSAIYLHCRAGVRSYAAGETLIQHGYNNVYSLDGGINSWIKAGYDVVTQP